MTGNEKTAKDIESLFGEKKEARKVTLTRKVVEEAEQKASRKRKS